MKVRFLGTAAAEGWPAVFCNCENCKKAAALDLAALREQGILGEAGRGKKAAQLPERGKAADGEKE